MPAWPFMSASTSLAHSSTLLSMYATMMSHVYINNIMEPARIGNQVTEIPYAEVIRKDTGFVFAGEIAPVHALSASFCAIT